MNEKENKILIAVHNTLSGSQRELAEAAGISLGAVNALLQKLRQEGFLEPGEEQNRLTEKGKAELEGLRSKRAVILAAGFGVRMAPMNQEIPKGLIEIEGQRLIDRLIGQLQEAGVGEINVVVGFQKEKYEYLIDRYRVKLTVNRSYAVTNNLHSLLCAADGIGNSYILPCDLWCKENPFCRYESGSWYMISTATKKGSYVRLQGKSKLLRGKSTDVGNEAVGICYLREREGEKLRRRLDEAGRDSSFDTAFWEEALFEGGQMYVQPRTVPAENVMEINYYEQLRALDPYSNSLESTALQTAAQVLQTDAEQIRNVRLSKKGMTNRSFLFTAGEKDYIMRIPGEGTGKLIDRRQEWNVYQQLAGKGISDEILYMDPENGYKISEYWGNARTCDASSAEDVRLCMKKLREFHERKLRTGSRFDLFDKLLFYEALREGPSLYTDYEETREKVFALRPFLEAQEKEETLCHIDAVPDNFLFLRRENGQEEVRLIDWEYAGLQDPHVDIAMFAVYAMYDRKQVDALIDAYFTEGCPQAVRLKIYCYIAVAGLLWSNWCEYKYRLGVEFGEYSLCQYRFAKEYCRYFKEESEGEENA